MAQRYKLSASPALFTEGAYRGKLRGVTFTAISFTDETDTIVWFTRNRGQFEGAFTRIMGSDPARVIHTALVHGDPVVFPGLYEECQFARGFMFEWAPIYFDTPHVYAFE